MKETWEEAMEIKFVKSAQEEGIANAEVLRWELP